MSENDWGIARRVEAAIPGTDPALVAAVRALESRNRTLERMAGEVERMVQHANGVDRRPRGWTLERWLKVIGFIGAGVAFVLGWTWFLSAKWSDLTREQAASRQTLATLTETVKQLGEDVSEVKWNQWSLEQTVDEKLQAVVRRPPAPKPQPAFPRDSQFAPSRAGGS